MWDSCLAGTHSDNIVVLTEQGIIEFANDAAELTLGYDFGGLLGKNLFNLMSRWRIVCAEVSHNVMDVTPPLKYDPRLLLSH